jgi:hypothetical protein
MSTSQEEITIFSDHAGQFVKAVDGRSKTLPVRLVRMPTPAIQSTSTLPRLPSKSSYTCADFGLQSPYEINVAAPLPSNKKLSQVRIDSRAELALLSNPDHLHSNCPVCGGKNKNKKKNDQSRKEEEDRWQDEDKGSVMISSEEWYNSEEEYMKADATLEDILIGNKYDSGQRSDDDEDSFLSSDSDSEEPGALESASQLRSEQRHRRHRSSGGSRGYSPRRRSRSVSPHRRRQQDRGRRVGWRWPKGVPRRRYNPFILPVWASMASLFYPKQHYYYPVAGAPYFDQLPRLPCYNPTDVIGIQRVLDQLRASPKYRSFFDNGYDIVPGADGCFTWMLYE